MTNITAFLLVLTLTGSPVASVVCVTECQHEPETSASCQADMARSNGPVISEGYHCNDPSIGTGPYVIEHRAESIAAILTDAWFLRTPELVRMDASAVHMSATNAWWKPPLVLRI